MNTAFGTKYISAASCLQFENVWKRSVKRSNVVKQSNRSTRGTAQHCETAFGPSGFASKNSPDWGKTRKVARKNKDSGFGRTRPVEQSNAVKEPNLGTRGAALQNKDSAFQSFGSLPKGKLWSDEPYDPGENGWSTAESEPPPLPPLVEEPRFCPAGTHTPATQVVIVEERKTPEEEDFCPAGFETLAEALAYIAKLEGQRSCSLEELGLVCQPCEPVYTRKEYFNGKCNSCHYIGHKEKDCKHAMKNCYNCGLPDHRQKQCRGYWRRLHKMWGQCFNCGILANHKSRNCPARPARNNLSHAPPPVPAPAAPMHGYTANAVHQPAMAAPQRQFQHYAPQFQHYAPQFQHYAPQTVVYYPNQAFYPQQAAYQHFQMQKQHNGQYY